MRVSGLALGAWLVLAAGVSNAADVTFTSFNVRFYGAPDEAVSPEQRDRYIREHLEREDLLTDVIAFQEIIDVERLRTRVLHGEYRCVTYDHPDEDHIHVVLCHKRHLRLDVAPDDDNYALEQLTLDNERLRPGVHGILKTASGVPLAHVVDLHLKASPQYSDVRADQAEALAEYLANRSDDLPVVIMGDLNTHGGDYTRINRIFQDWGLGLRHLYTQEAFTWRVPANGRKFDRIWVSSETTVLDYPDVRGPCNVPASRSDEIRLYNDRVSDHCPVTMRLSLAGDAP